MKPEQPVKSLQECRDEAARKQGKYIDWNDYADIQGTPLGDTLKEADEIFLAQFQRQEAEGCQFTENVIARLQHEVHKITGDGEVMVLFNKILGISKFPSPPESK